MTTANTVQAIYFNLRSNLSLHGAKAISIARGCEGLDFTCLEQLLEQHRPVLYLTNTTLHNPTGHSFSPAQVYRLLELSHRYDFHIVEDDLYCDIQHKRTPRLAAAGGLENISYVSGFTKTSGGVTSELAEQMTYRMLSDGSYTRHARRLVDRLYESNARVAQCDALPISRSGWAKPVARSPPVRERDSFSGHACRPA